MARIAECRPACGDLGTASRRPDLDRVSQATAPSFGLSWRVPAPAGSARGGWTAGYIEEAEKRLGSPRAGLRERRCRRVLVSLRRTRAQGGVQVLGVRARAGVPARLCPVSRSQGGGGLAVGVDRFGAVSPVTGNAPRSQMERYRPAGS